jgi:hypothetical protein
MTTDSGAPYPTTPVSPRPVAKGFSEVGGFVSLKLTENGREDAYRCPVRLCQSIAQRCVSPAERSRRAPLARVGIDVTLCLNCGMPSTAGAASWCGVAKVGKACPDAWCRRPGTCLAGSPRLDVEEAEVSIHYRSDRNAARISVANSSGSSQAAK